MQESKLSLKHSVFGGARQGAKQWNEDSFCHYESPNKVIIVGAVFDGHGGYNGLRASNMAREATLSFLNKNAADCEKWSAEEWKKVLIELFDSLHNKIRECFITGDDASIQSRYIDDKKIVRNERGDPVHGGSTGTVTVIKHEADGTHTVICANVGDSASFLMPRSKKKKISFLSVDHGPENPDEYKRLQELPEKDYPTKLLYVYDKSNVFRKYECPRVFLKDGTKDPAFVKNPWGNGLHPTNVRYEPAVYAVTPRCVSKDTTCIAMTRALGDFYAQQFGLTHIPSVKITKLPANEEMTIVVASDGVWDCWKYEDFKEHINAKLNKGLEVSATVTESLDESIHKAIANFGSKHYDDASMVLIRIFK